ncbi:hypothetical protein SEA_MISSDAISY_86 [Mycobacterium phage MissDaisy]|nr:hypothetical protein SEA_MISSDAISY_86 [Mycobacterium phage MissDaisy]
MSRPASAPSTPAGRFRFRVDSPTHQCRLPYMSNTTITYQGRKFELSTYVDPYPGKNDWDRIYYNDVCCRCGGSGVYRWWTSVGQASGTCFGCFGTGKVERSNAVSTLRRQAKEDALWREYGDQLRAEMQAAAEAAEAERQRREWEEAWEEAHREQARRAALNNEVVGEVGERVRNIEATVQVSTSFERASFTGCGTETVMLVIFKLDDGRVIKSTGTGLNLYGLDRGDRVKLTGTVKGYGEYKGQRQTILQRVKVEVVEAANPGD